MGNIPALKSKDVIKILKKHGFVEARQSGSHLQMVNYKLNLRSTVPVHNSDLKKKTLISIFKQAGIDIRRI